MQDVSDQKDPQIKRERRKKSFLRVKRFKDLSCQRERIFFFIYVFKEKEILMPGRGGGERKVCQFSEVRYIDDVQHKEPCIQEISANPPMSWLKLSKKNVAEFNFFNKIADFVLFVYR